MRHTRALRGSLPHGETAPYPTTFATIVRQTELFLYKLGLRSILLPLPIAKEREDVDKRGVRLRLLRNRSSVVTEYNPEVPEDFQEKVRVRTDLNRNEVKLALDDIFTTLTTINWDEINEAEDRRSGGRNRLKGGFMFLITEDSRTIESSSSESSEPNLRPVAGTAVVPSYWPDRELKLVFCRRSIPDEVAEQVLKVAILRTMVEAFVPELQACESINNEVSIANKILFSVLGKDAVFFPRLALQYITEELDFKPHWDVNVAHRQVSHNDAPRQRCQCATKETHGMDVTWWGILCSRFQSMCRMEDHKVMIEPTQTTIDYFRNEAARERAISTRLPHSEVGHTALPKYIGGGSAAAVAASVPTPPSEVSRKKHAARSRPEGTSGKHDHEDKAAKKRRSSDHSPPRGKRGSHGGMKETSSK